MEYTQDNMDWATERVLLMKANMGGTNMSSPLSKAYGYAVPEGVKKKIFLLTDGADNEPGKVNGLV